MTSAACHTSVAASESAAADAPTKFGMRPRAPGNAAARWSSRRVQMRLRIASLRSSNARILASRIGSDRPHALEANQMDEDRLLDPVGKAAFNALNAGDRDAWLGLTQSR